MKKIMIVAALAIFAQFASADDNYNYYYCTNANPQKGQPDNVLLMANSQTMAGFFNGANPNPPRAFFQAKFNGTASGGARFNFGPVQWQGEHTGFQDFTGAAVDVDSTAAIVKATFDYSSGPVVFGNCKVSQVQ